MNVLLALTAGLSAGLATSPHCLLMCGPLDRLQLREAGLRPVLQFHAGRVLAYALLGAVAGGLGLLALRALPSPTLGVVLQTAAAGALIVIGGRRLRVTKPRACGGCGRAQKPHHLFAQGLLRGAMPCVSLYAMLLFAAAARDVRDGAAALLAFGIGTTPLLAAGHQLLRPWTGTGVLQPARSAQFAALALVGSGGVTLMLAAMHGLPLTAPWCLSPAP